MDFFVSVRRAPDRWKYLITWGWLDLLSSVPTIDVVRWGRAARVVRVFRVLRGLRATKIVSGLILHRRAENTFLAASLIAMLLIIFCSVAALHFEVDPDSNIKTAEDAIWWAFATIATVGYGDRYPVTSEGRFVAAILMSAGVGLFGTFSGFLAVCQRSVTEALALKLRESCAAKFDDNKPTQSILSTLRPGGTRSEGRHEGSPRQSTAAQECAGRC